MGGHPVSSSRSFEILENVSHPSSSTSLEMIPVAHLRSRVEMAKLILTMGRAFWEGHQSKSRPAVVLAPQGPLEMSGDIWVVTLGSGGAGGIWLGGRPGALLKIPQCPGRPASESPPGRTGKSAEVERVCFSMRSSTYYQSINLLSICLSITHLYIYLPVIYLSGIYHLFIVYHLPTIYYLSVY